MHYCFRFARLFWLSAFLLMGLGQIVHAYGDLHCPESHEIQKSDTDNASPQGTDQHTCCHSHAHVFFDYSKPPELQKHAPTSHLPCDLRKAAPEGIVQKIEYPPRRSLFNVGSPL